MGDVGHTGRPAQPRRNLFARGERPVARKIANPQLLARLVDHLPGGVCHQPPAHHRVGDVGTVERQLDPRHLPRRKQHPRRHRLEIDLCRQRPRHRPRPAPLRADTIALVEVEHLARGVVVITPGPAIVFVQRKPPPVHGRHLTLVRRRGELHPHHNFLVVADAAALTELHLLAEPGGRDASPALLGKEAEAEPREDEEEGRSARKHKRRQTQRYPQDRPLEPQPAPLREPVPVGLLHKVLHHQRGRRRQHIEREQHTIGEVVVERRTRGHHQQAQRHALRVVLVGLPLEQLAHLQEEHEVQRADEEELLPQKHVGERKGEAGQRRHRPR